MITDERSMVGWILNGGVWTRAPDEQVLQPRHEVIVRAALVCKPASVESVALRLEREGLLEHVGGLAYLAELAGIADANQQEAHERGYRDGREAQAGNFVRVYPPEELPFDVGDWEAGTDLDLAYCDGWDRGAYDMILSQLARYDLAIATGVLMQFAYGQRPDTESIAGMLRWVRPGQASG